MAWLFDQIAFPDRPRVLELGCGTGALWSESRHRLPNFARFVLTDLSSGMLESTQQRLGDVATVCLVVDAQCLPFADDSFDVVIANHVLHHCPSIGSAVAEIRRVLSECGRFYAGTNGLLNMVELFALMTDRADMESIRLTLNHFNLENGGDHLRASFGGVERCDFANDLQVTEVQPVIDYLESTQIEDNLTQHQIERARIIVAATIANVGAFRIRKSTGILIAR